MAKLGRGLSAKEREFFEAYRVARDDYTKGRLARPQVDLMAVSESYASGYKTGYAEAVLARIGSAIPNRPPANYIGQ